MGTHAPPGSRPKAASLVRPASSSGRLQRKCACGGQTTAGGECAECAKKKMPLQRQLTIGASQDPLEQEADRVADRVLARPIHPAISEAPVRIQRSSGPPAAGWNTAPPSVDRVLASPGRPLDPAVQRDMGQRFGHDFSRVQVHVGAAAAQSARDVHASAYTVGTNVVFGAGQFAPHTHEGRHLIAHELTHVVQQGGAGESARSPSTIRRQPVGELGDEQRLRKARESGASWAKGGNPIRPTADKSHFGPGERDAFIRGYIDYARRQKLTQQYDDARKAYPWADSAPEVPDALRQWLSPPSPPPPDAPRRVEPDWESPAEKAKRTDEVEVDAVDVPEPPGRDIPKVSPAAVDPRSNSDYVERRCTAVGYGIYVGVATVHGGGYLLYCNGITLPILLPSAYVNFGAQRAAPASSVIHGSRDEALAKLPPGPPAAGVPQPYAFYRGSGGLIIPTVFSPGTTPRLLELMLDARKRLGKEVSDELTVLAITIVGGRAVQVVVRGLVKVTGSAFDKAMKMPPKAPPASPSKPPGAPAAGKPAPVKPPEGTPPSAKPAPPATEPPKAQPPAVANPPKPAATTDPQPAPTKQVPAPSTAQAQPKAAAEAPAPQIRTAAERVAPLQKQRDELRVSIAAKEKELGRKSGEVGNLSGHLSKARGTDREQLTRQLETAKAEKAQLENELIRLRTKDGALKQEIDEINSPPPKSPQAGGLEFEKGNIKLTSMPKNDEKFQTSFSGPDAPDGKRIPDHVPKAGKNGWEPAKNIGEAEFVADSKLLGKKLGIDQQVRGFIELASKTRQKVFLVLSDPGVQIADSVHQFAKSYGVRVITMTRMPRATP